MTDFGAQHSDPNEARRILGFPPESELRARVAETMATCLYTLPLRRYGASREAIGTQTLASDASDAACGDRDPPPGPPQRTISLELDLPTPAAFPQLSAAQLLEAERRVSRLLARLELEIARAETEDHRARQLAAAAMDEWRGFREDNRERQLAARTMEELQGYMAARGTRDDGPGSGLVTTDAWSAAMAATVGQRMRRRYQDDAGEKPPSFWVAQKLDSIGSPSPWRRRNGSPPPPAS